MLVGDSCLNRYQLALTALCGTHPPSFPTDLFQAEEHVDSGFGGDVSDLHSERCSLSSLSALLLVFLRRQDLVTKKNNLPGPIPTTSRCCSFLMEFLWITYGQFIFALGPSQNNLLPILVFENSNTLLISTQLFDAIQ